jgi:hypothetical protein
MSRSKRKKTKARRKKFRTSTNPVSYLKLPTLQGKPASNNKGVSDDVLVIEPDQYPYDETLLERSRTQWQFGDWKSLSTIDIANIQCHPDRAKLALLAATAHLQLGNTTIARTFTHLAKEWGCPKNLINQLLIAGVHNSLGRAAALTGKESKAYEHFCHSVTLGIPGSEVRLLAPARANLQLTQLAPATQKIVATLGQSVTITQSLQSSSDQDIPPNALHQFRPHLLAQLNLGHGWAGNSINTVIFRHHAILTLKKYQYTAFYIDEKTLRIVQRNLQPQVTKPENSSLRTYDIPGNYNLRDAHNSINLGYDRKGHLHLCYDHHSTKLRYRRAIVPDCIEKWTDEIPMTGKHEDILTYPTFLLPHHGHPLTLLYREGSWNKGCARLKTYNEVDNTWTDHPTAILSGSQEKPWSCNAYWNNPVRDNDGTLHLSFVWRTHSLGAEQRINNINICYAYSKDNGHSWFTSRNRGYRLPITPVNAETVFPVSPGSNLINQCSMAIDSNNLPHIAFYADDLKGIPQYHHLWFDGKSWQHQIATNRTAAFNLQGGGTLQIPISRPEILIDQTNNVFLVYQGDLTNNRLVAQVFTGPEYKAENSQILPLWDEFLGFSEPIIDRGRWHDHGILTLFLQNNLQPNGDRNVQASSSPITIIDLTLLHQAI